MPFHIAELHLNYASTHHLSQCLDVASQSQSAFELVGKYFHNECFTSVRKETFVYWLQPPLACSIIPLFIAVESPIVHYVLGCHFSSASANKRTVCFCCQSRLPTQSFKKTAHMCFRVSGRARMYKSNAIFLIFPSIYCKYFFPGWLVLLCGISVKHIAVVVVVVQF